jgi:hypothetical protein
MLGANKKITEARMAARTVTSQLTYDELLERMTAVCKSLPGKRTLLGERSLQVAFSRKWGCDYVTFAPSTKDGNPRTGDWSIRIFKREGAGVLMQILTVMTKGNEITNGAEIDRFYAAFEADLLTHDPSSSITVQTK